MNSARTAAPWESAPRRKRRPAAPALPAVTAVPRTTTVQPQSERNVQARVIAVLLTGLALLIISLAGVRLLGSDEPQPEEPAAVLAPNEVFVLEQAKELDRERSRATKLADKIDRLLAANKNTGGQLKEQEERLRLQGDDLRSKTDALRKAEREAQETAAQLRTARTALEEKDRLLGEKEDLLRQNEARLKTYENAKRANEQRIRDLEKQLSKATAAARQARAAVPDDDWPALLRNNAGFGAQVRELKRLLDVLDREADPDAWSATMREAGEIMDGLSGRLRNYAITDAAANDARSFLSDTLPGRLYALKKQKR